MSQFRSPGVRHTNLPDVSFCTTQVCVQCALYAPDSVRRGAAEGRHIPFRRLLPSLGTDVDFYPVRMACSVAFILENEFRSVGGSR